MKSLKYVFIFGSILYLVKTLLFVFGLYTPSKIIMGTDLFTMSIFYFYAYIVSYLLEV